MDETVDLLGTLALSAGIGLLVGLERERKPSAKAGVRTFALIALLGSLAAVVERAAGSGWIIGLGALAVAGTLVAAYLHDRETITDDSGTTTIIAAVVVGMTSSLGWILLSGDTFSSVYGLARESAPVPFSQPGIVTIPLGFATLVVVSLLTSRMDGGVNAVRRRTA